MGDLYNRYDNYYAPLCFIIHKDTEQIVAFGNIVPLISDPFETKQLFENWEKAGLPCDDFSLSIIHNDYEFDKHMKDIIKDNLVPIIDPKFGPGEELEEGVVIKQLDQLIQEAGNAQPGA